MRHLILGAGPAGVVAAETLRKTDPSSSITLVCGEVDPPYARMSIPYLLTGRIAEDGTYLRKEPEHYRSLGIELVQGRAASVGAQAGSVTLTDGRSLPYDRLLVATGATPTRQKVPGIDLPGVHTCWTLADVRAITASARPGTRVVQMGAGFVGCIIMQGLVSMGVELTVLVRSGRMVSRMMNPPASAMLRRWCESKGVRVLVNTLPTEIHSADGELKVKLPDGNELSADLYLNLIGVKPNVGFLQGSGVAVDNGVLVDAQLQTSVPGIYAAGDVAEFVDIVTGRRQVNAIQPNAVEQGRLAALNMTGKQVASPGSLAFNVLTTLGLVSSSFGEWQGVPGGESAELLDEARYRYLRLEFEGDRLIGSNSVGWTQHAGALRGLIEGRANLGPWKARLMEDPTRIMQAYLACVQKSA
jgi:NAD(P)H-nitrite reductase large subunit